MVGDQAAKGKSFDERFVTSQKSEKRRGTTFEMGEKKREEKGAKKDGRK